MIENLEEYYVVMVDNSINKNTALTIQVINIFKFFNSLIPF